MKREFEYSVRFACPLCKRSDVQILHESLFDDRFGQGDVFSIAYCSICDFAFLREQLSLEDSIRLYNRYYPYSDINDFRFSWRNRNGFLQKVIRFLSGNVELAHYGAANERVLDVGCGSGTSLQILDHKGATGKGIEIDERCIAHLRKHGLSFHAGTLEQFAAETDERFDVVLMNQLLEHVYEPLKTLHLARKLLRENGRILVSCPSFNSVWRSYYGRRWIHWHVPYHVNFFSKTSFTIIANELDMQLERFTTRTPLEWAAMNVYLNKHTPSRGVKNEHWTFSFSMLRKAIFVPHNILVDAIGRGDAIVASFKAR